MKKILIGLLASCMLLSMAACGTPADDTSVQSGAVTESSTVVSGDESIFDGGSGTESDPYQVSTAEQLLAFGASVNDGSHGGYAGQYIQLTADIDLDGVAWTPIGNMNDMEAYSTVFLGTFDGGNHTISNLTYESDAFHMGAGLFGISCGTIQNLTASNFVVSVTEGTSMAIGGVIGYNMGGTVDHVTIDGAEVTGNAYVAGIAGGHGVGSMTNCSASNVTITVIGDNDFSEGLVQTDTANGGGLIIGGGFGGTIDNCTASGTVKATGNEPVGLGGIGGCLEMMDSITNCTAEVTIESQNGGHAIGGLCGYAGTHSDPDVCYETEGVLVQNYPAVVENCAVNVTMNVAGATHVGGLIGTGLYYYGEETAFAVTDCSVTGAITGAVTPGAIAGRAEGSSIRNCTFDVQIDGKAAESEIGTTSCMYESADQ